MTENKLLSLCLCSAYLSGLLLLVLIVCLVVFRAIGIVQWG